MAYVTKYNLTFKDYFQTQWDIDFQINGYSGPITDLVGTGDPVIINYEASDYFTHSPIKASSVEINLIELTDDAYREFFTSDKAAKIKIHKGTDLFWQGWTIADCYSSLYNLCPKQVKLIAVDGLTFLKNIPLPVTAMGGPDKYQVYKYFKAAFDAIGFNCSVYQSMAITYFTNLDLFDDLQVDTWCWYEDEKYKSLYEVLTDILMAFGLRVYQKDGCWYIDHISQLDLGVVTYRVYTYLFAYTTTSAETLNKTITSKSGSPLIVPINHSLYKELDRPFSKFELTASFRLNTNLIRYPKEFDATINYRIDDDDTLYLTNSVTNPFLQGINYNLGYVDFENITEHHNLTRFFIFTVSGETRGMLKFKLYVDNIADSTRYYYNHLATTNNNAQTWYTGVSAVTGSQPNSRDLLRIDYTGSDVRQAFSETVYVYHHNRTQVLKGHLHLLINPPYDGAFFLPDLILDDNIHAEIDLTQMTLKYMGCKMTENVITLENSAYDVNEKNYDIKLYSDPRRTSVITESDGSISGTVVMGHKNSWTSYPGLVFYYDSATELFNPCYQFRYNNGDLKTIEEFLTEDIMSYYSSLRNRLLGTLLGQINFGNVLDYDSKRYMIASMALNIKKAQNEVTLIQISDIGSFLLDETGDYILTEDGDKIGI